MKRRYAEKLIRNGGGDQLLEAKDLLTLALNEAGVLKERAVLILSSLLSLRADVSEMLGDEEGSQIDRERACSMNTVYCNI